MYRRRYRKDQRNIINLLLSLMNLLYTIPLFKAGWQSGYAAACKAVYAGSIPASASNYYKDIYIYKSIMSKVGIY